MLTSEISLAHFDQELRIIVALDASKPGIGVVILHKLEKGNVKLIAHV